MPIWFKNRAEHGCKETPICVKHCWVKGELRRRFLSHHSGGGVSSFALPGVINIALT